MEKRIEEVISEVGRPEREGEMRPGWLMVKLGDLGCGG